jgi:hypothetical protein
MAQRGRAAAPAKAHALVQKMIDSIEQTDSWQRLTKVVDGMMCHLQNFEAEVEKLKRPRPGGSKAGRKIIRRDFVTAYEKLWNDYFAETPVYSDIHFSRRYRVSKKIFGEVYEACQQHPFFAWKANAALKMGIHPLVKVTAIFRHFAYGISADALDEQYHISETTVLDARVAFCDVRFLLNISPIM